MRIKVDRRALLARLGGAAAIAALPQESLADALEQELMSEASYAPPCADLDIINMGDGIRRGAGQLFARRIVGRLPVLPERPKLVDFFRLRFSDGTVAHCLKSAAHALSDGQPEHHVMAALVHDLSLNLMKADHAWWGADLIAPYVDERVAWAVRHHQALRFFPDKDVGYEYPELYRCIFGRDYEPEPYIVAAYEAARRHRWYMDARMITVNDTYGFVEGAPPEIDDFVDIIGRNWRDPAEGLGADGSSSAHMWRTLINPDRPL